MTRALRPLGPLLVVMPLAAGGGVWACSEDTPTAAAETLPEEPTPGTEPTSQPGATSAQELRDGYAASAPNAESDGRMRYGRTLVAGTPEIPLAELLADAQPYAGKTVRTSGKIARVCKAMGCWMELQGTAEGDSKTLRAPMAGHAFFLPQDAVGKPATVEGAVALTPLTQAQKAHYRAEGMQATEVAVSLDAESVVIGGP